MLNKKLLFGALAGAGALAVSSLALADDFAPGVYVGLQGGYADTNWSKSNLDFFFKDIKDTGFGARAFLGYDFTKYLALEAGYTYLPKTKIVEGLEIKSYALDVVGKIKAPVYENTNLYAKLGVDYLHSKAEVKDSGSDSEHNYNVVYGVGASYNFTTNVAADVSWTRYNGNAKITSDKYQPYVDFYAVGVSYKFVL